MLVLSRKKAEQIQIGDNITITILKIKGAAVQIGVEAPIHVKVLRSELSFDAPAPVAPSANATVPAKPAASKAAKALANVSVARDGQSVGGSREDDADVGHTLTVPVNRLDRVTLGDTLVFRG